MRIDPGSAALGALATMTTLAAVATRSVVITEYEDDYTVVRYPDGSSIASAQCEEKEHEEEGHHQEKHGVKAIFFSVPNWFAVLYDKLFGHHREEHKK
ncbi:MAG: hypothetical protein FJZ58_08345 [Chlamydiae bacterium]|nr:hypothetical protein [Chlamydiota bacterium]